MYLTVDAVLSFIFSGIYEHSACKQLSLNGFQLEICAHIHKTIRHAQKMKWRFYIDIDYSLQAIHPPPHTLTVNGLPD